ncbi:MAG: hypothetical protein IPI60_08035 [Saprospiraceae bacterium]|jgi:hypothetical protein|nr:hypothetical protein [Saprospiraceae bacterium]
MQHKVPAVFAIVLVILFALVLFLYLKATLSQFEMERKVQVSEQLLKGVQWAVRGQKDSCDLLIKELESASQNDTTAWKQYLEDLKLIRDKFDSPK